MSSTGGGFRVPVRRIVTGHDEGGNAVFVSDGEPPETHSFKSVPGQMVSQIWTTNGSVQIPLTGEDPTPGHKSSVPAEAGSTRITIVSLAPESVFADPEFDAEAAVAEEAEIVGMGDYFDPDAPGFHRTPTIDYIIVLEGELVLELDDGDERTIRPGDTVVQNGTRHAWRNRTGAPATFAGVMIGRPA
jgi:uncharacterized cupin superfamily protein